jgi:uncharacterized protein (DUF1800 family)
MARLVMAQKLSANERHLVQRMTYGFSPALAKDIAKAGGAKAWWASQLSPKSVSDPVGDQVADWFPDLWYKPKDLWDRAQNDVKPPWELMPDFARWTMMRRMYSTRQVHEVMVDFWSNLLHVPIGDEGAWPYRIAYDKVIRKHALGRFDDMLVKCTTHPCMGLYLDNAISTKDAPNENLGRELLELHSVGVGAGYAEADVLNAANMLTGHRVDLYYPEFRELYIPDDHYTGKIKVMGFTHPNTDPDGRKATRAMIRYLARHPATAKRLALRLCQKFVSDDPSADILRTVERAFTRSKTNIRKTIQAMVDHPDFKASAGAKVRMPLDDLIASTRALRIKATAPASNDSFANSIYWVATELGQPPYTWTTPDGFPEDNTSWASPGRALDSFEVHRGLGARWYPTEQVEFPDINSFVPKLPTTYDKVIKHASKKVLGEKASKRLRQAVSLRSGIALDDSVDQSVMTEDRTKQLLVSLLDSPQHMMR